MGGVADVVVHAATDRRLHRPVAVTVVPPASAVRTQATVVRAHTAATLSHPSLLTVLDAGQDDGGAFVVTERVEGTTLADRLVDGPMGRAETVAMLDAVLAALEGLHRHGLAAGGVAPWQVRLGVDGMWTLAVLPASDDDAAPLPLGGPVPTVDEPGAQPAWSPAARHAADLAAVGSLTIAALTGGTRGGHADPPSASPSAIDDPGLRALAVDALASQQSEGAGMTATALRRRLPGGAPAGLPATLGLPAPSASTLAHQASRPAIRRLRRMARALTGSGSGSR